MTLFTSREEFATGHAGTTKWDRMMMAIDNAGAIEEGVAHSIGDSLTYWRGTAAALADDRFTGHRRYQTVLVALDGQTCVEVAPKAALSAAEAYSDLSDRERFVPPAAGEGTTWVLSPGQIFAVPVDQAWRIVDAPAGPGTPDASEASQPHAQVLVLRITVEGATFHNK